MELAPLPRLLVAHAGARLARHRLIWAYDARLADIVRTTSEPMIGQMRLTWWHDVLTDEAGTKGRGDPLVGALRTEGLAGAGQDGLLAMIDGWEALLDPAPEDAALRLFGEGRGGGLFRALAGGSGGRGDVPDWLNAAGTVWALWDLAGHVSQAGTAERAMRIAQATLADVPARGWRPEWKPMRIAFGLARHDALAGRRPLPSLTPGLYGRLIRIALFGR
jgi:phytoene synthase